MNEEMKRYRQLLENAANHSTVEETLNEDSKGYVIIDNLGLAYPKEKEQRFEDTYREDNLQFRNVFGKYAYDKAESKLISLHYDIGHSKSTEATGIKMDIHDVVRFTEKDGKKYAVVEDFHGEKVNVTKEWLKKEGLDDLPVYI